MHELKDKHVLLGVSGGIAAYKAAELVRLLKQAQAQVRVTMTGGAQKFITPLTFQALSGNPVHCELFNADSEAAMDHISLARWADLVLIAPTSANLISKIAHGGAEDLLQTVCLATQAPLVLAPAMNQQMWQAAAVQDNCTLLRSRGIRLLGPATGEQACGEVGPGRMLEPRQIIQQLEICLATKFLPGARVLINAGPTQEAMDPVRYISNRSSGKMGYELARAAVKAGAEVTLVSGPVHLDVPSQLTLMPVKTAEQMRQAICQRVPHTDILIAAAAVSDYRPRTVATQKIKKDSTQFTLDLERTHDILAEIGNREDKPFLVGFAAESESLQEYAQDKLKRKGLDMIAANDISNSDSGFDVDTNALQLYWQGGEIKLGPASKEEIAEQLLKIVSHHYYARH